MTNRFDTVLNKLGVGDRVRVVGALIFDEGNVRTLSQGVYGSIIKIGHDDILEPHIAAPENGETFDIDLNVNKGIIELNNIRLISHGYYNY